MKLKYKILIYFTSSIILLIALAFISIYLLFSAYREEEFQQRQKDKIQFTLQFLSKVGHNEKELAEVLDELTINSLLNEKILIFNKDKKLIYASLDDMPISYSKELINNLNEKNNTIEKKDGLFDVVAIYFRSNNEDFYGISKAYDKFGYSKLFFLRNVLILLFIIITTLIIIISLNIANRITKPITLLANRLSKYKAYENPPQEKIKTSTFEIKYLNEKFNELIKSNNEAFMFQKNSIQHISHQLKTPLSIVVSELERIKNNSKDFETTKELEKQVIKVKWIADIINILLEITKMESSNRVTKKEIRIDELIFDIIDELNTLNPNISFQINYIPEKTDIHKINYNANTLLLKEAFQNLIQNAINYSNDNQVKITINTSGENYILITIKNQGETVQPEEAKYLFTYFFRGKNSYKNQGIGLGLVLSKKIIELHGGSISYKAPSTNLNIFEIRLPLS